MESYTLEDIALAYAMASAAGDTESADELRALYEQTETKLTAQRSAQESYWCRDMDTRRFHC